MCKSIIHYIRSICTIWWNCVRHPLSDDDVGVPRTMKSTLTALIVTIFFNFIFCVCVVTYITYGPEPNQHGKEFLGFLLVVSAGIYLLCRFIAGLVTTDKACKKLLAHISKKFDEKKKKKD